MRIDTIFAIIPIILFFGLSFFATANVSESAASCQAPLSIIGADNEKCSQECQKRKYAQGALESDNKCCCIRSGQSGAFDVNPLGIKNIPQFAGNVIRALLGVIGIIALAIFIYGGALWMLSLGDEQRVTRARETMIWAGLGLIAVFGSYVVVQFILDSLLKPPPTTAPDAHAALRVYDNSWKERQYY